MRSITFCLCAFGVGLWSYTEPASAQTPLGTEFTYQGQLKEAGVPADGDYDLLFRLFDAKTGGLQIGSDFPADDWPVSDGLFTVEVDFGAAAFAGEARWLEIVVNGTTLSPRQELTPAPYASTALQTVGVDGHSLDAADGSPTDAVLVDSDGRVRMETGGLMVFDAVGQGIGLTSDSFQFAESTSEDPVYDYSSTTATHRFWTIGSRRMVITADGGVGIGTDNPGSRLHVKTTAGATAIVGDTASPSGTAIHGWASNADLWDSSNIGVHGRSDGDSDAVGVYGEATNTNPDGTTYGVRGVSAEGTGVRGDNQYTGNYGTLGTSQNGVYGRAAGNYDAGMRGVHANTGNYGTVGTWDAGVRGIASGNSGEFYGVYGTASGTPGESYGVYGIAPHAGVHGEGAGGMESSYGVRAIAEQADTLDNYGIYARAENALYYNIAGFFVGDVNVIGHLSKSDGSFQIDHPLDPANKYLRHSFVESPDMMNVYNGNAVTDANGYAEVTLPEWFETLNRDFRYQLTVIDETDNDTFVQAKVVRGVRDNRFRIRTSEPGTTVSWQVTGIRQDPWANAHRIRVEEEKREKERGSYLHPELYGQTKDHRVDRWLEAAARRARTTQAPALEAVTEPVDR